MVTFTSTCLVHRAEILQLQGAWADALAEARRACELWPDGADERPPGTAFYQQGEVLRLRGELDAAETAYRSASAAGASSISRTFEASDSGVNGFCRKAFWTSTAPNCTTVSSA